MSDEPPATSAMSQMFPAYLSLVIAYLPPLLPKRLTSGPILKFKSAYHDKAAPEGDSSDAAETEPLPVPPSTRVNLCHDTQAHTQNKNQMGFRERFKYIFRKAAPSKE